MGSDSSSGGPGGKLTSGWASPSILGLLAFGLMTILLGLLALPSPYSSGFGATPHGISTSFVAVTQMALAVGGLLVIIGVISLIEGHLYWGSAFLGYGIFWGSWGWATHHLGFGSGYGEAAFMFLWLMFTLTFLVSSIKHGWATLIAFLFLFVGIILLLVVAWQTGAGNTISSGEHWAVGGELIATGLIWWYGGTAQLTNHSFAKKFLPV